MSNRKEELAARLRQALQGCSQHIHGPVQAWIAIEEACAEGSARSDEIAKVAIEACTKRIAELKSTGAGANDLAIKKEEQARAFIERLLL